MWKKLSNLPRHEHNYAFLLKHFGCADTVRSWFDSTSNFDTQFNCDHPGGGYCSRRICKLPSGKLLAVCNDDEAGCTDLPVTKSYIRLHSLNLSKIAGVIAELTKDAFIYADVQAIGETLSCIRIGHYMPRGTIRYPVFLGVAIYDGDTDSVISYLLSRDKPAIMLLPSIEDVPQAKINAIKSKGSALLGLQIMQGDGLIDSEKVTEALKEFFEAHKDPDPKVKCKQFNAPSGATWEKFIFEWQEEQLLNDERTQKAHKREVIIITCGDESQRYEPADLQMLNQKTKEPTLQWTLLRSFIQNNGIIGWGDQAAADNVKTQKKELIKKLKKACWQTDDPIPYVKGEGYKCRFICRVPENTL